MGNFLKTQNSFACGEMSAEFYAINNQNGLSELENMDVLESGGLKRRPGLKKIGSAANGAILVPFAITENEKYLLVLSNLSIEIYSNDVKIATVNTPWHRTDLPKLQYAQRFNNIFFVHPDYQPRVFTKNANSFNLNYFDFSSNAQAGANIPFMRFDDMKGVSIEISNSDIDNNYAVFTTNIDFWTQSDIGERLLVNNKQWVVSAVQNARSATVYTNGSFISPGVPLYDWYEAAFSTKRGWPGCVSFHQNRLVFAGTHASPNSVWMSKVGDFYNFDAGTGLDDEAIYVALLSAQHHQICTLVSSDKLQILTSVGEWAISNSPLTPSNVDIKQHTSIGSPITRYLPPQQIESRTVFISASTKDIRELDLDALGENYNAIDLCTFAKHLMNSPISMAYNQNSHQLFIVMDDGSISVLTKYNTQNIAAWAKYKTDGNFLYVGVLDDYTYVIVKRGNAYSLEKFDETCLKDAAEYGFSYKVSAFPMIVNNHCPKKLRARKISVRVINTKTLYVNNFRMEIPNSAYFENSSGYTGDLTINLFGTENETMKPLWTISSSEQLPATILSVSIDGWYSI